MAKIILDGIIEGLNTRTDGSVKIVFSTQELDSTIGGTLFQFRGKYCKVLFSDSNITKLEEEIVDNSRLAQVGKQKTASQRLRSVLYVLWQQKQPDGISSDDFYKTEMENFIQTIKSKLD